jgi:carbon starvation protein
LIVSIWLKRNGRPYLYTLVPMVAVSLVTAWAMVGNLVDYYSQFEELWLLSISGTVILALDIWIVLEGLRTLREVKGPIGEPEF